MTITAGAHSSQPSRRSALAPSDSCFLCPGPCSRTASVPAATGAFTVIAVFLPLAPATSYGGSRDQALRLQCVRQRALQRRQRSGRVDARSREDLVPEVDAYARVDR